MLTPKKERGDTNGDRRLRQHPGPTYLLQHEHESASKSCDLPDFLSDNGPDLFVYLATDTSDSDIIDLGALRATSGTLTYEIPEAYDAKYDHVLIWCDQFSVLFGSAELSLSTP